MDGTLRDSSRGPQEGFDLSKTVTVQLSSVPPAQGADGSEEGGVAGRGARRGSRQRQGRQQAAGLWDPGWAEPFSAGRMSLPF